MIAATLLLIAQAGAGEAVADECMDPQDQLSINLCALADYEAADAELNAQWKVAVAAMRAADAEIDREYDKQPGYYETLLEAQRAWLKLRDAQCLLESFDFRGGSGQPMIDSFCKAEMTRQRTAQLKLLVAGPES